MAYRTEQEVAEYLAEQRASSGYSLDDLATRSGVDESRLAAAECGDLLLSAAEGILVAEHLGVPAERLWESDDLETARFRSGDGPAAADISEIERRVDHFRRLGALLGE